MEGHGRGLQGKWVGRTGQEGRPGPALALSTAGRSAVLAAADLVPERWLCVAWPRVWSAVLLAPRAPGAGLLGGGPCHLTLGRRHHFRACFWVRPFILWCLPGRCRGESCE